MNFDHGIRFPRIGAGSMPRSRRIRLIVLRPILQNLILGHQVVHLLLQNAREPHFANLQYPLRFSSIGFWHQTGSADQPHAVGGTAPVRPSPGSLP
jgi:hypothetical protein